jgi:histidyl-tRNA synthetase
MKPLKAESNMSKLQPVRGTHDLYGEDMRRHRRVVDVAREVSRTFGYEEFDPPVFEFTDVFARSMGETSDVVSKEMYSFADRGGEGITLRPEFTAGICRAVVSEGMAQNLPLRFFAQGPLFRYERPQKGRQRQFHQIGAELFGIEGPQGDVEMISMGAMILEKLGILPRTVLEINTLGDTESRAKYRDALVQYFTAHKSNLSEDSLKRLEKNPLRILDSKDEGDRKLVATAPEFGAYMNDASKIFFKSVQDGLSANGVAFKINSRLVRGLDYYCHTAFEFVTTDLGSQGTVMAGGRYDGMTSLFGGPNIPAIGWGAGVERLRMLLAEAPANARAVVIVPIDDEQFGKANELAMQLRKAGVVVELGYSGNVGKRMKRANNINAKFAVMLGKDELASGQAKIKDMDSGEESSAPLSNLTNYFKSKGL